MAVSWTFVYLNGLGNLYWFIVYPLKTIQQCITMRKVAHANHILIIKKKNTWILHLKYIPYVIANVDVYPTVDDIRYSNENKMYVKRLSFCYPLVMPWYCLARYLQAWWSWVQFPEPLNSYTTPSKGMVVLSS